MRLDNRDYNQIRDVHIQTNFTKYAEGSILISIGDTKVICNATVEEKIPSFLRGQNKGWITSEYSMLPRSTKQRTQRESLKGKVTGRTMEIQRLISRSLRSVVDLEKLGDRTIYIDCDVIQADGGTRTASITGAFIAMSLAIYQLKKNNKLDDWPISDYLAATSVGILNDDKSALDLSYIEDSSAKVDMNIIMTGNKKIVEIQGTGEEAPFSRQKLNELIDLAEIGINTLLQKQKDVLIDLEPFMS